MTSLNNEEKKNFKTLQAGEKKAVHIAFLISSHSSKDK